MNEDLAVWLADQERLDDLLTEDLQIIQSERVFSFSMDAVLLARFCSVPTRGRIMDLCSGNGVIPLLLSTRTKAQIDAVEIQEEVADMARRSIALNRKEAQINIMHDDLRMIHEKVGYGQYDHITVNPPYLSAASGMKNSNRHMAYARHELGCTLEDVLACSNRLIKSGGKVAMVHRPARLTDIMEGMRKYRLEPKRVRFVHPRVGAEANMVLIEAMKDGKPDLRLLPPLIVHEGDSREYSPEIRELYYGNSERGYYASTKKLQSE